MRNAISIDLEDWFHPEILRGRFRPEEWPRLDARAGKNLERILRLLDAANVRGTFFVLGWVAENEPRLVPRLAAEGHEIASHGYAHAMITQQEPEEFAADLQRSIVVLEAQANARIAGYRAPSFSIVQDTLWALDVLLEAGIEYDSSIFPVHHDRYGIPTAPRKPYRVARRRDGSAELWELPPPTLRVCGRNVPAAGGGYLRLLPYAFNAHCVRRMNREGLPAIVYTHPWELDVDQPRLPMSWPKRLRHYTNVDRTEAKLARLLREFTFTTCRDVLEGLRTAPTVQPVAAMT